MLLAEGLLREDLYHRLRGFEIHVPPLRERREDIGLLVAHFLDGTGSRVAPEALPALERFGWPGNVRHLRNVLGTARILSEEGIIRRRHLALDALSTKYAPPPGNPNASLGTSEPRPGAMLKGSEYDAILHALRSASGKLGNAARVLGIHRSTLRRKMREHGIRH